MIIRVYQDMNSHLEIVEADRDNGHGLRASMVVLYNPYLTADTAIPANTGP